MKCKSNKWNKRNELRRIYRSGNKVADDFIRYTQTNGKAGKMEFVPYDQFQDVEFFAEGGFSKLYKATWIIWTNDRNKEQKTVALKRLNGSKNITSKDLNELLVFHDYCSRSSNPNDPNDPLNYINNYYGITQDPYTEDFMIIMDYYRSGDLRKYITNNFEESWCKKLTLLRSILRGLHYIHSIDIIHRDFHSGNIIYNGELSAIICDLGISKSPTASTDDDEIYGIIPYIAPEVFQKRKYTTASDIYSLGMIMWEFMTGRRPFWNRIHDTDLIIQICDGIRPPIVTNAPEGYIELMQKCWHPNPNERPKANDILEKLGHIRSNEYEIPIKIILSSDVGPVIANNPGAIYKSRPLSSMIKSATSTRSLTEIIDKSIIKNKLLEDEYKYLTRELSFDIYNDTCDLHISFSCSFKDPPVYA